MATPPPTEVSKATTVNGSSPVGKATIVPHAAHIRKDVQKLVVGNVEHIIQVVTSNEFWNELYYDATSFRQQRMSENLDPKDDFETYMDKISKKIRHDYHPDHHGIFFYNTGSLTPRDHPTATQCRPDYLATPPTAIDELKTIHWTDIEATVEIRSSGTSETNGIYQAIVYTYYLLQARPDRVSVLGMYADKHGVVLIITSATGVKRSEHLTLSETNDSRLLHAFVNRLYKPHQSMVDPTIVKRFDHDTNQYVFDITLKIPKSPTEYVKCECVGYTILFAQASFGQRTHVFVNEKSPAVLDGHPISVIKDQYRHPGHRFTEAKIIKHLHEKEEIPGVVHVAHSEYVAREVGSPVSSGERHKTRICMLECGKLLMDLATPKEVLMAIYDLLEVTRFMYFKRRILHRDISEGNVLCINPTEADVGDDNDEFGSANGDSTNDASTGGDKSNEEVNGDESSAKKADEAEHKFCSIGHLLNPKKVDRNATPILLVDFDRGEILDVNEAGQRKERMGTTVFMAKAIRTGGPHGQTNLQIFHNNAPQLSPLALAAYEKVHPDRLKRFPSDVNGFNRCIVGAKPTDHWRHSLYHDAESAYWLLLRWAILASPSEEREIPAGTWESLNGTDENVRPIPGTSSLDPAYSALATLLGHIGHILLNDIFWATDEPWTHPDFIHEAMQRLLLNFIFENQDKPFTTLRKAAKSRQPKPTGGVPLSMPEIQALRTGTPLAQSQLRTSSAGSKREIDEVEAEPEPEEGAAKKARQDQSKQFTNRVSKARK